MRRTHAVCAKTLPVFHAPGKSFYDRAVAWVAGGTFALSVLVMSVGFAAQSARAAQPAQGGFTLGQLMGSLAQRKHGEVAYREEDYFAILDRPVKSSGVLVYDAPDRLEKRTLKPKKESLVLQGDDLTAQRGRRIYHLQLSAYPQVAPLVAAIRDTLGGNEAALERVFKVDFTGTEGDWKLRLVPLDEDVARKVSTVEIAGARDEIRSVTISQVDGDRSVMTLGPPHSASAAPDGTPSGGSGAER
jgi:hypothetical protein